MTLDVIVNLGHGIVFQFVVSSLFDIATVSNGNNNHLLDKNILVLL